MQEFQKQLEKISKPIIGCFPLYPPVELLHSFGLHPIILWGLKSRINSVYQSDKHLQDYTCSVARHLTELLLEYGGNTIDSVFHYNACDTLRNLPEVIDHALQEKGKNMNFFSFHLPMKSMKKEYVQNYLKLEIADLITELEEVYDHSFSEEKFLQSIKLYNNWRKLYRDIEEYLAEGRLSLSEYLESLLDNYFLPVEEQITNLDLIRIKCQENEPNNSGFPIILSGILPPSREIAKTIENAGLRVVGNDLAIFSRFIEIIPRENPDPKEYYLNLFQNHFPCTTLLYLQDNRVEYLINLMRNRKARGFVYLAEKFCEYENFEIPYLKKRMNEEGFKLLQLEFSINDQDNLGSYTTRIEAFSELLEK